jgi:glycosyltransferase involved in cell wall biosynthesis
MIVKDEAHVIGRCLGALKTHIDYALIIDTGSTDDTVKVIKEILPDATIGHSEFISFRHNRTELLEKARETYPEADYHLMIDADDTWVPGKDFEWPEIEHDAYMLKHRLGGLEWWRPQVFRASKPFRYVGAAHEALHCDEAFTVDRLMGVRIDCGSDGARRLKEPLKKYERVAAQLQAAHDENPVDRRTVFYLAQSYRDSLEREKALKYYELRSVMGGWGEEVWYSKYQIGSLKELLGRPVDEILAAYMDAYKTRPSRSEPLVSAAMLCRRTRRRAEQMMYAATAIHIPRPENDRLFVEWQTYDWKAWDEFAMACWHQKRFQDAMWANFRILCQSEACPEERIIANMSHCSRPGEKLDALKDLWREFRGLDEEKRDQEGVLSLFDKRIELREFEDEIYVAVENGGGFPQ